MIETPNNIDSFDTVESLQKTASDQIIEYLHARVTQNGSASVSLSGGSTPKRIYEQLSQSDLPWDKIHWFWGDERNVPADDEQSNFRMVRLAMLEPAGVPDAQVHPVVTIPDDPKRAAMDYENTLREHFSGQTAPAFDLVLLGMGDDGHTASLFPHTAALAESNRWFVENWVEKFDAFRYTMTAHAISAGLQRWFLVTGAAKKPALSKVWDSSASADEFPSKLVTPTRWFVTQETLP